MNSLYLRDLLREYKKFLKTYHHHSPELRPKGDYFVMDFCSLVFNITHNRLGADLSDAQCEFLCQQELITKETPIKILNFECTNRR